MGERFCIERLDSRRVLNSHCDWTLEFAVQLSDGRRGRGAAPKGETPSIYENTARGTATSSVLSRARTLLVGRELDAEALDALVFEHRDAWGRSAVYAISVACFEALRQAGTPHLSAGSTEARTPAIYFNLVNGGLHAYTNPITCDFTEFLLVPKDLDSVASIEACLRLLGAVSGRLSRYPTRDVGGNRVADLGKQPNEAACAFVRSVLADEGLDDHFGVMIDASAGDWADEGGYRLPVSGLRMERAALVDYWLGLIDRFHIDALEDPLGERDLEGWKALHDARPTTTAILGDNFTSTDPDLLELRADSVDGVLLKPDQAGTASRATRFAAMARSRGLQLITSHRSIETDSPFLVHLSLTVEADAIKIGPFSDLTSVVRTNELIRETLH
jgi:enolase 1/2/3